MDVIMPQLGETVAEGTVTRWYKKVGDAIKADEALFDVLRLAKGMTYKSAIADTGLGGGMSAGLPCGAP